MSDTPEPKADHALPFHFATYFALLPPAVVNWPPAYTSVPDTANAETPPFSPDPKGDQELPFHLAM